LTTYSEEVRLAAARLNIRPEAVQTYLDAGRGLRAPGVERSVHTTLKPIGALCNLDCTYCYYLSKEELLEQKTRRISDEILEQFIVEYIAAQDAEEIVFTWHGGEPTLMGLPFFQRAVELQKRHLPPGRRVSNDLQTNGTLLTEAWCAFLAEEHFLVGLSIDGPAELHDFHRPTKGGDSSFHRVMAGARLLQKHAVPFSALTTVNRQNAQHPLEVYRFLRDDLETSFVQFIPCVEPRQFERVAPGHWPAQQLAAAGSARARPDHPLSIVTEWSVDPDDWGRFLIAVFDEWATHDRGRVKINLFESMFDQLRGRPAHLCTSSPTCGKNVALENDGRVYSCDHFVYPEYELGRLGEQPFGEMVFSLRQLEFGLDKFNTLPSECRSCPYLKLCWGECPRTRLLKTREGEGNLSYLCSGWKRFYAHVAERVGVKRGWSAGDVVPLGAVLRAPARSS
jgi:uncharacterized protein